MSTGEQRRVAVITGAGGKLGDAFCRRYAGDYDIVAVCRSREPRVASQHDSHVDPFDPERDLDGDKRVYVVRSDLERPGESERIVELVLARHGRVDLLVNNAALTQFHPHGLIDGEAALNDFGRFFHVNVEVPMRLGVRFAQEFWTKHDLDNRADNRNIVNVSSLSGHRVYPGGQGVYASSKAALNHLTRYMAAEFADFGVRVNGLSPTSFPALVPSEKVAEAVVRLDNETVTGKILVVNAESTDNEEPAGTDVR